MSLIKQLDAKLEGAPETVLTVGLILAAIVALIVAITGTPTLKATVLGWILFP
jgi:hypothetical protein